MATSSILAIILVLLHLHAWAPQPIRASPPVPAPLDTDILFKRYHVYLIHDVNVPEGNPTTLTMHCWSVHDDLGRRIMTYHQEYMIRFRINFDRTTRFLCWVQWGDKETMYEAFTVAHDEDRCRSGRCYWAVRPDGFYFSKDQVKWNKEHEWGERGPGILDNIVSD